MEVQNCQPIKPAVRQALLDRTRRITGLLSTPHPGEYDSLLRKALYACYRDAAEGGWEQEFRRVTGYNHH